tara:strand:+ start:47 stop:583 length:537 start_codon:yes stop_codon:yes gene_type:complete
VSITAADAALENFVITCQYMFEEQERAGQNVLGGKEKGKNAPRHSRLYGGGKGVYFNTLTTMAVAFQETCSDLLQLSEVACNGEESFPSMTDWEKVILPTIVKALKANILGVDAWENSEWKARVERAVHVHRYVLKCFSHDLNRILSNTSRFAGVLRRPKKLFTKCSAGVLNDFLPCW